jgi:uncharacterized protein (DUF2236 family)
MPPPIPLSDALKRQIRRRVVELFNDPRRGEKPVKRSTRALFAPHSIAWRVHGDIGAMMVGGIASLLLQMLHPAVLAGVWDHSNFRADMHGRLRRTARFIATTTYADAGLARTAIARVRAIHEHVTGTLPDGTPYRANDPALLSWVHITETSCFLDAWIRYGEPYMSAADQDRYFEEMAPIGEALGAERLPRSRAQAREAIDGMRNQLRADARTKDVAALILRGNVGRIRDELPKRLVAQAAIDLLPAWARRMHQLSVSSIERPLIRFGAFGAARTLRWAFE